MKKVLIYTVSFLFLLMSCKKEEPLPTYIEPENLIVGQSFESDNHGFHAYTSNYNVITLDRTDQGPFDGTSCLRMNAFAPHDESSFWSYELYDFDHNSDKTLKMKVRIRTVDISDDGFQINIYGYNLSDETNTMESNSDYIVTNGAWQTIEHTISNSIPLSTDIIDFYFLLSPNEIGKVYIDKFELFYDE